MARIFICGDSGQVQLLEAVAAALREEGHQVDRGPVDTPGRTKIYSDEEIAGHIAPADVAVFTTRHAVTGALMEQCPSLRGLCFPVTGVETLDRAAAAAVGVIVGHGRVRGNAVGMAEATLMLMLMLFYDVQGNIALVRQGAWRRPGRHSRSLEGKTIGLIGFGRIAREVAPRLQPFGVRILTASPRLADHDVPPGVEKADLSTLLRHSDLVSILTGLTPETRHLLGAPELDLMRAGALLVNTGRGEVVDEQALYERLRDGRIGGAALDTFAVEPLPLESPLRDLDNVILTPHCVGHTAEGVAEFAPALLENIRRILRDETPLYCVNPEAEPKWRDRISRLPKVQ